VQGTNRTVVPFASVSKQQKAENLHLKGIQQTASTFSHIHYIEDICTILRLQEKQKTVALLHLQGTQGSYS
jgi:hypothetical protein